ncbi:hypothetical protein ES702_04494 [subsurface metagenome]
MKLWITLEPDEKEILELTKVKAEGVSKTPLKSMMGHAYLLMEIGHEVSLKVTTMKRRGYE